MRLARLVVALFCLVPARSAIAAKDPPESRLDPALKLLHRANQGRAPGLSRGRARQVLDRLHGRQAARGRDRSGKDPELLTVLIKYTGERSALETAGFTIQAQLGSIYTGTLDPDRLGELAEIPGVVFVQSSHDLTATAALTAAGPLAAVALLAPLQDFGFAPDAVGTGALLAYIDTGVDITHQDFRRPDGTTRIKFLLDF